MQKKERRAEARLPFPPSHNKGGMRETLVLYAADSSCYVEWSG